MNRPSRPLRKSLNRLREYIRNELIWFNKQDEHFRENEVFKNHYTIYAVFLQIDDSITSFYIDTMLATSIHGLGDLPLIIRSTPQYKHTLSHARLILSKVVYIAERSKAEGL